MQGDGETRTGVITAQLAAVLLAEPASFRQRTLVSASPGDVTAISIEGEGGPRRLVKSPWPAPRGGSFRFDGSTPEGAVRMAASALDELWDAIGKVSAETFLTDAEADKARILENAERQAVSMKKDAEARIAAEIEMARTLLTREVTIAATKATEELLKKKMVPGDQQKLVSSFISDVGGRS